jgi:tRNA1(Val) A37 N6-methylase TrmN6
MNDATLRSGPASEDSYLGGRLRLRQKRDGHRAGSDAILLAAAAPEKISGIALDLGAGVGAAGLALAALRPELSFGLVENDPDLAALARDNLALNGMTPRGAVYEADLLDREARRFAGLADAEAALVITNPPFFEEASVRVSPDAGKRAAHVMAKGVDLDAWIAAALALLADGGVFIIVHRPENLPAMLEALAGRVGEITLKPVQPHVEKPATRLLLRARKGSRAPLSLMEPLVLHDDKGFTRTADAIHRGAALVTW